VLRADVSLWCSSPCAHRALIAVSTCFPDRLPFLPFTLPGSPGYVEPEDVTLLGERPEPVRLWPPALMLCRARASLQGALYRFLRISRAGARDVLAGWLPRYSLTSAAPSGPPARKARVNARRRCASSKHSWLRCRYAPRPGKRAPGSGTRRSPAATRRSKPDLAARSRQPTHVRTGGALRAARPDGPAISTSHSTAPGRPRSRAPRPRRGFRAHRIRRTQWARSRL
jgi:hypothetical protein